MRKKSASKTFTRKMAVAALCVMMSMLLCSCSIHWETERNPSRQKTLKTEMSYKDGVCLKTNFKGGTILYGRSYEQFDGIISNYIEYEYFVKARAGEELELDLSAFAPTKPETTDSRVKDSEGNLVLLTYPTTVKLKAEGFPGDELNGDYYSTEIGSTGASYEDTFKLKVPAGTNDAKIKFTVSSYGVFDMDPEFVFLPSEYNEARITIRVNPPSDEVVPAYTEAATNGGDALVTIPVVVATAALSSVTAACAVAAQGTKAKKKKEDGETGDSDNPEEEDSGFQMVVSKDFGNSVKRGAKPVSVYARIQEVTGSGIKERPDLAERISVACEDGLKLSSYNLAEGKMGADVCADAETQQKEGVVAFTFNGDGGSFTYRVVFNIVGDPLVRYFKDDDRVDTDYTMPAVRGDNGVYEVKFFFDDVSEEPKKLEFEPCEEFNIVCVQADLERTYIAKLTNLTQAVEKSVFAKPGHVSPHFKAVFPNGDEVVSSFDVELYSEGLNITSYYVKDDRMIVSAKENKDAGDLDYKIQPTEFTVLFAESVTEGGKTVTKLLGSRDVKLTFGEIEGEENCAHDFAKKFKFKVNGYRSDEGIYAICPETVLAQTDKEKPFLASLPITCSFKDSTEEAKLPMMLEGELPSPGPSDWEKEYELLKRTVEKFGLSPNGEARKLLHSAKNFTANELCAIRRAVIVESNIYYSQELAEWQELDKELGQTLAILNTVKFLGDQAFAYLVTTYGGGPMVEAFATPMKDMFTEWAGEYIAAKMNGEEFTYGVDNFYSAYMSGCENAIVNMLTGEEPVSPGKVKWLVAAFLMINYTRHYALDDETKGDIFKSLLASFGDISVNFVKAKMGDVFKSIMDKKLVSGKTVGDWIKKFNPADMYESAWRSPEIVEKYFTEVIGVGVQAVYDKASGVAHDMTLDVIENGFSLEIGTYVVVISNPVMLVGYLVKKGFEVLFDCVKELIPSTPKPIYDLDCHNYYRPSEITYRYDDDSTGPRKK